MLAVIGHLCIGNGSVPAVIGRLCTGNSSVPAVIRSLVYRQQLSAGCDQVTCVQVTAQCWL